MKERTMTSTETAGTPRPTGTTPVADELRAAVAGTVLTPADETYDAVRAVKLGGIDTRPAVVVRPQTEDDVAAALAVARRHGLPVAVRSGGHSSVGYGSVDDGVVIDVRDLADVEVDAQTRTAWVGAGATAGQVSVAAAEHGLAIGFGDTGSVGVAGITLGGGVGYLSRAQGLTIDNLLAADVVLADGRTVRADATSHPDLFWALRGGGGNFGVVTRLQYRLHPVPEVTGGMLFLPATAEVVAGLVTAMQAAPEELGVIANVMPCPPMPFVPAEHHGSLVVMALVCFAGTADDAAAALAPIRALATPLADLLKPMTYPEMFPPEDPSYRPVAVSRTMFLDHVDTELAARALDGLAQADGMRALQLRALGGAIARVPADATAYAHRSAPLMANVAAFVNTDDRARKLAWIEGMLALLDQG
ncbi:FAD-linked oxidase, partial [Actinotalea fermentans ATCC 43279 = JCM 9966 = DSM 3133]